jgi:hypothetical protein
MMALDPVSHNAERRVFLWILIKYTLKTTDTISEINYFYRPDRQGMMYASNL